ncbi:hypothetical protein [Oceanospirillum sediminis]|nr:hypothetical protein [Oceanospirillum sediminis]
MRAALSCWAEQGMPVHNKNTDCTDQARSQDSGIFREFLKDGC